MQRVMDLPGWIPQPGGAHTAGDTFPITADQVTIESVIRVMDDHLMFSCRFNGRSIFYDFPLLDKKTGEKVEKILHENRGKTLLSIGSIAIS